MKYRIHECWECSIEWEAEVVLSYFTQNLSGEKPQYCPLCGKKSTYASEVKEK